MSPVSKRNWKRQLVEALKKLWHILLLPFFAASAVQSDGLTAYFHNDSLNGFQLSDAYETHNMGLRYDTAGYYALLDLGIVTPDMHVYRNEFREANRAFGELITIELGEPSKTSATLNYYVRVTSSGQFGIDKMQDFAHRLLSLQTVKDVNDLVRMPPNTWIGTGLRLSNDSSFWLLGDAVVSYDAYLGSDSARVQVQAEKSISGEYFDCIYGVGMSAIIFDEIVSAPPVEATARSYIPFAKLKIKFDAFGHNFFESERVSLPTIQSDERIFAVLSAGVTFDF
jgi:hypothetical protein